MAPEYVMEGMVSPNKVDVFAFNLASSSLEPIGLDDLVIGVGT
jgi:hypothetical protein